MTDSKDDLYPKDLYPQGTPHRKNDQESQGGSAVEPLFPSAPHTSQSWLDHADDIHAGDVHAGDVYTDKAQTTATPADFGQSHADTPDHNLYEDNARGDSAQGKGTTHIARCMRAIARRSHSFGKRVSMLQLPHPLHQW